MGLNRDIARTIVVCFAVILGTVVALHLYATAQKTIERIENRKGGIQTLWDANSAKEFLGKK